MEALCHALGSGVTSVLEGVASLFDKSLLQQMEQLHGEPLLMMLETIREYGLEALEVNEEMEVTRQAYADYYLALAEKAELELGGPQQVMWLERLDREHDNLRAALRWSVEQGEVGHCMERALRLGGALRWLWIVHCQWSEGRTFLERALVGSDGVMGSVRAKALEAAGRLALVQGDTDRGEALCKESLVALPIGLGELCPKRFCDSTSSAGGSSRALQRGGR